MSDITRDDLRVIREPDHIGRIVFAVTDEEFDRLVLERIQDIPGKALRALLTDKCEHGESKPHIAAQKGMAQMVWTCPGWLPKDEVIRRHDPISWKVTYMIPGDWLEAEDER